MAVGLVVATATAASAADTIRVAIVDGARAAEVRGADIEVSDLGGCERCAAAPWHATVVRATAAGSSVEIDGRRAIGFRLRSARPVRLNGREYPATLEVLRSGEGLVVVNELPLEDYVMGVVRAETPDRWPAEALKAQAIVARTYAVYQRLLNAGKPFHLVASTADQAYVGAVSTTSPVWAAIRETAGQVLHWEGSVFPAFYHAESGGYTEDPRMVFAAKNLPALRPVRDDFSAGSPHFAWSLDVRLRDLSEALRRNGIDVGSVVGVEVGERTPSLRAAFVTVQGARGTVRVRGNDFRRMLGYQTFRSTLFAVAVDREWAHFAGRGYGHGVGLSQWGARAMAEQGYSARQIVEFYYPGTTLGLLEERSAR